MELHYDGLRSNFAFDFNVRHNIKEDAARLVDHELISKLNFPGRFPEYVQMMVRQFRLTPGWQRLVSTTKAKIW